MVFAIAWPWAPGRGVEGLTAERVTCKLSRSTHAVREIPSCRRRNLTPSPMYVPAREASNGHRSRVRATQRVEAAEGQAS